MRYFAQLDINGVCTVVSQAEDDVNGDNVIEITNQVNAGVSFEDFRWKKYENSAWSAEKFEPVPSTQISPLEQKINDLTLTLGDFMLGGI